MRRRRRPAAPGAQQLGRPAHDTWVTLAGTIVRLLPDDRDQGAHQRFILDAGAGQSVLIAHNLDVAGRVPIGLGDRVRVRGLYEWNDLGGLVHWTHDDPMGHEDGGFIEFRGRVYR